MVYRRRYATRYGSMGGDLQSVPGPGPGPGPKFYFLPGPGRD
jgi:hypothetical protein